MPLEKFSRWKILSCNFFRSMERLILKIKNVVFAENLQFDKQLIVFYPENYSTQEIAASTSFSISVTGQRKAELNRFYCINIMSFYHSPVTHIKLM